VEGACIPSPPPVVCTLQNQLQIQNYRIDQSHKILHFTHSLSLKMTHFQVPRPRPKSFWRRDSWNGNDYHNNNWNDCNLFLFRFTLFFFFQLDPRGIVLTSSCLSASTINLVHLRPPGDFDRYQMDLIQLESLVLGFKNIYGKRFEASVKEKTSEHDTSAKSVSPAKASCSSSRKKDKAGRGSRSRSRSLEHRKSKSLSRSRSKSPQEENSCVDNSTRQSQSRSKSRSKSRSSESRSNSKESEKGEKRHKSHRDKDKDTKKSGKSRKDTASEAPPPSPPRKSPRSPRRQDADARRKAWNPRGGGKGLVLFLQVFCQIAFIRMKMKKKGKRRGVNTHKLLEKLCIFLFHIENTRENQPLLLTMEQQLCLLSRRSQNTWLLKRRMIQVYLDRAPIQSSNLRSNLRSNLH
jgi:hypothetical protein